MWFEQAGKYGQLSMRLTNEQIADYQEHGFLLLPDLIAESHLDRYEARFVAFATEVVEPAPEMIIMRDIMVVQGAVEPATPMHAINKLINFEDDPTLYGYSLETQLLACVRDLIGAEIFSISTNVFNKPPDVDGRHPLHQDLRYFRIRPADKIVATWTALNTATNETGCLAVIPASHKGELYDHAYPDWEYVNAGFFGIDTEKLGERVHVEMQRGDTLLFHPLLIHGSGRNLSQSFRRAISSHYASSECESPNRDWRVGKRARRITV